MALRDYRLRNILTLFRPSKQRALRVLKTPFNLAFRIDVVILVENGINTLQVAYFDLENNKANIQANLDLLKETREEATIKAVALQRQVAQYYNKRVKVRQFNEGDLILRNYKASTPLIEQKKLSANQEGPNLILVVVDRVAYKL